MFWETNNIREPASTPAPQATACAPAGYCQNLNDMNYEYGFEGFDEGFYPENVFPEEVFDEFFGPMEAYGPFDEAEAYFPNEEWEAIFEEIEARIPEVLQEAIYEEIEGLSPEEAREAQEAFPAILAGVAKAILPILKTVGTKAVGLVKSNPKLATNIAGGFLGKLLGKKKKKRKPHFVQPLPSPTPPPSTPPANQGNALSLLIGLMSNQQVLSALSGLASTGRSQPQLVGPQQVPVREGAMLNALIQLARQAKTEIADEGFPDALEYLKDEGGTFAVDLASPQERAQRFLEVFYS